jgi:hypothetical protein
MTLLLSLLIFLPKILAGFAIAHRLWKDLDVPAILLKLAIGVPLGLSISSSAFFLAALAGIPPKTYSWLEFWAVLSVVIFLLIQTFILSKERMEWRSLSRLDILGASIVAAGAVLFAGAFFYYARMYPYGFEDAWSIWNLPARFIFRENSPAILLNSEAFNLFHPDYPVGLSLSVAWGWFILDNETFRIPIAVSFLSTFPIAVMAWAALRMWKGILAGALGALVLLTTTHLPSSVGQYADPLFTLHVFSAAAVFFGYLKSRDRNLFILAGLLAGFSAWVKNEGILFVVVFLTVCLLAAWKQVLPWNALKRFFSGLVFPVLVVVFYKSSVAWQSDLLTGVNLSSVQALDVSRWLLIGQSFLLHILNYANWPISLVIILAVYALLIGKEPSGNRHQILLFLLFAGQLAGYFFIYLVTPHDLQIHIHTSMDRLVYHVMPLAVLWVFGVLPSPDVKGINQTSRTT